MKVTVESQPREFIQRQSPDARKQLRETIRALENEEIFPLPLDDELEGFYKLKVNRYRLIVQLVASPDGPFFRVVFAERRKVVYQLFSQILGME